MQEIVSPFRQIRLSAMGSAGKTHFNDVTSDSLEDQHRQMESTQWQVNPIKVRRNDQEDFEDDDFSTTKKYYDAEEDQLLLSNEN